MTRDRKASEWFALMRGPDAEKHRAVFEDWLRDPHNAAAYASYEDDWHFTRNLARADVPPPEGARSTPLWAPLRWAAVAAAAIALICAWYLQATPRMSDLASTETAASPLRLADGSSVLLMDGAQIETEFTARQRNVYLKSGRARFTVAHDANRPLVVHAGNSQTTALGTVFEIDLRGAHPRVHLIAGAVEVRASPSAEALRLVPGESAEVEGGTPRRVTRTAGVRPQHGHPGAARATTTIATMLEADALPLRTVIEAANQVNPVPIRLADPALGALALSGRFDLSDSGALARKLAAALDLEVANRDDAHVLSARRKNPGG